MAEGARSFQVSGGDYDAFMGRYSTPLAALFADDADVRAGHLALDVGCGPGALTGELVRRLGSAAVRACDPSPTFVAACAERFPGVQVQQGQAEDLPFDDGSVDRVLAQLVMHFVGAPDAALSEMVRVLRPGGVAAACVWDFADGMELLRHFWDAALEFDPDAPDEARELPFGNAGELHDLFLAAGLVDVREVTLRVESTYADVDELWATLLRGVGPAGSFCVGLSEPDRAQLRGALSRRLGSPSGAFTLGAVAHSATGRTRS